MSGRKNEKERKIKYGYYCAKQQANNKKLPTLPCPLKKI
jgi:hypothetical protein